MKRIFLLPASALLAGMAATAPEARADAPSARRLPPVLPPRPGVVYAHPAAHPRSAHSTATARPRRESAPVAHARSHAAAPAILPTNRRGLGIVHPPNLPVPAAATGLATPILADAGIADERLREDAQAPEISLEDALALTLANNPRRREAQAAVNAATSRVTNTGAQGRPQVGLSGSSTEARNTAAGSTSSTSSSSASSGGGSSNGGSTSGSSSAPDGGFQRADLLSVTASVPITSGGRVRAATRAARYDAVAQIYQLAQVEQDLVLSTTLAYLDVLRNEQLLRVTNSNLAVSRERLRVAQVRYSVGASARLDVLRARTDLADASTRRIAAANELGTANAALNTLLGRAPETPIRLASIERLNLPNIPFTLRPSSEVPASSPSGTSSATNDAATGSAPGSTTSTTTSPAAGTSLGGLVITTPGIGTASGTASGATGGTTGTGNTATGTVPGAVGGAGTSGTSGASGNGSTTTSGTGSLTGTTSTGLQTVASSSRQSLAVTQAQIGAAEANVEVARAGRRPQIGLSLTGLLRNPATFLGNFGASIGIGLAQTLFDSHRTSSQVEEAQAALEQLRQRLAGQRLEVADAIEASLLSLDSAQRRQASTEVGVDSAREALRVAQVGFRSGVRTTLDLADAQAALLAAETSGVNARFEVADAQATLAAAVGIYTEEAQAARERTIRDEQEAAAQAKHQAEILQASQHRRRHRFLGIF